MYSLPFVDGVCQENIHSFSGTFLYGIATERYKLMHFYYDIDEWEMYDLQSDPSEMKNIYNDPEYAEVQKMLHERLEGLRVYYGDSDELNDKFLKAYLDRTKN